MKNIKIIFILLSLIAFSPCAVAQTPKKDTTKKFLRAKKHLNSVAKETQKLERTLSEPELKKPVKDVKVPVEETTVLTAPENEPSVAKEIILEEKNPDELKAEQQMEKTEKRSPRGWLLSAEANTNMGMIRANDSFGRQLKLVSSLGFGGYASIGYRFDRYIAIVGDYGIDRMGFDNFDTYTITQSGSYLMSGRLGPRFYLTNRFSTDLLAGLRQHYVVYTTSLTNINVEKFNHGSMTLGFNYAMVRGASVWFSGRTELEIFLSATRTTFKTSTGIGANTNFKIGVPVGDRSAFYLNMGIGYTNVKPNIASQYGVFGFGGLGFVLEN